MTRLKIFAGMIVFFAFAATARLLDLKYNYEPVSAEVSQVSSTCFLQKVEDGFAKTTTTTTDTLSCAKAERLHEGHPNYRDMAVKGEITIKFYYNSPADQTQHSGALSYAYESNKPLAALSYGASLPILASKSNPNSVAPLL